MLDTAFLGGTRAGLKSLRPAGRPDGESNEGLPSAGKVLGVVGEAVISPNQEKVRSTTQRRGRTMKPFMSSMP